MDRRLGVSALATLDVGGLSDIARKVRDARQAPEKIRGGIDEQLRTAPSETPTDALQDDRRKKSG